MVFKCQTDSFLKEFATKVVKIEKTEDNKVQVNFEVKMNFLCRAGFEYKKNSKKIQSNLKERHKPHKNLFYRIRFCSLRAVDNQRIMEQSF